MSNLEQLAEELQSLKKQLALDEQESIEAEQAFLEAAKREEATREACWKVREEITNKAEETYLGEAIPYRREMSDELYKQLRPGLGK